MVEVKLIPATCPKCGASLSIPGDIDKAHCVYCGTQIIIGRAGQGRVECMVCDGFGRIDVCRACNGTGKCTWYMSLPSHARNDLYSLSYGSQSHCFHGNCSACGGRPSGSSFGSCPFCGGTGRCPRCLGTAKCSACRGIGVIPGPSGSQVCPGCGGKGYLEGEPLKAPELGKCPECGVPMAQDMFFCEHCGFRKGARV